MIKLKKRNNRLSFKYPDSFVKKLDKKSMAKSLIHNKQ